MLNGENVNLRPIVMEDLSYLNAWKNDYDVFKNLGGGFHPVSKDQQINWMDNLIDMNGQSKRFIIEVKNNGPIGMVGLYNINYINRNCEFGIYIGEKKQQGKGFGSEATKLALEFAFNNLNLKKIKLLVNAGNPAIKMYEEFQFKKVGKLEKERFINGKYIDVNIMEKIKEDVIE